MAIEFAEIGKKQDKDDHAKNPSLLPNSARLPQDDAESSDLDDVDGDGDRGGDDEDLDDPDQLVDRWMDLQISKFKLEQRTGVKGTKHAAKQRKVMDRISKIERDMLFDTEVARQRWEPHFKDLQIEAGHARKQAKRNEQPAEKMDTSAELLNDASDTDELLGGMFGEEEEAVGQQDNPGGNEAVTMRDFGTWSGAHPRRLLEEVATGLLSRNGVRFRSLLTTSFS